MQLIAQSLFNILHAMAGLDRYEIKAEIARTRSTLAEIARKADLDPSSVRTSLRYPIPAANRAIAQHLGKSPHQLWPDWFDQAGERRTDFNARKLREPQSSRKAKAK